MTTHAKKLSLLDAGWLSMETLESPMHVGSLQLYALPDNAPEDYLANLYAEMLKGNQFCFPFNRKLKYRLPGALDAAWIVDEAMDIEYHVRHSALPKPGRVRELLALVSRLHAHRLDRRRPMWECHLIEGLEGNRFAIYVKMHHSLIDGVAGSRLLQSRLSDTPQVLAIAPWSVHWERPKTPKSIKQAVFSPIKQVNSLARSTKQIIDMTKLPRDGYARAIYQAPDTLFNQPVTPARRFAAQSWSLSRIKAAGAKHGATLNDIFLAMCAGCVREYLLSQDALPQEPLVAQVPVALRSVDAADEGGNAITAVQVNLGTHLADPIERLRVIKESVQVAKKRLGALPSDDVFNITALTNLPLLLGQITRISGRLRRPLFNLVISNVPGPKVPLYLGDAQLLANYPVSLIWHGYALNITVQSYCDNLDVGIIACRNNVPRVQRMLDYMEAALVELE